MELRQQPLWFHPFPFYLIYFITLLRGKRIYREWEELRHLS